MYTYIPHLLGWKYGWEQPYQYFSLAIWASGSSPCRETNIYLQSYCFNGLKGTVNDSLHLPSYVHKLIVPTHLVIIKIES